MIGSCLSCDQLQSAFVSRPHELEYMTYAKTDPYVQCDFDRIRSSFFGVGDRMSTRRDPS